MIPQINVTRIVPMFKVGKNTALGSIPARAVLSRLQQPNASPTPEAMAISDFAVGVSSALLKNAHAAEAVAASMNAVSKNAPLSSATCDFCCTFCIIPSPPDASIAISSGMYPCELSAFDLVLKSAEHIIAAAAHRMPTVLSTERCSDQKSAPERVGRIKPIE